MAIVCLQAPHAVHMRNGVKMGNTEFVDTTVHDGLTDAFNKIHMGITGQYYNTIIISHSFKVCNICCLDTPHRGEGE